MSMTNDEKLVLKVVREKPGVGANDLAKLTGLTAPRAYRAMNGLIDEGLIRWKPVEHGGVTPV